MKTVTTREELFDIIESNSKVFLKIGTECCGGCVAIEKNLNEIEKTNNDYIFLKIDADDIDEYLEEYIYDTLNVNAIPCCIKYISGFDVLTIVGYQTIESLQEILQ